VTLQAHAQAVLTLLDADNTAPALVVLDGTVPVGQTPPYVLCYFMLGTPSADLEPDKADLTYDATAVQVRAYCHSVAGNAAASRAVATRVRNALLNVVPTVSGRSCFPIRWQDGQPQQRDESTGTVVFDQVDIYGFMSVPG
jgi:hypothetical protein